MILQRITQSHHFTRRRMFVGYLSLVAVLSALAWRSDLQTPVSEIAAPTSPNYSEMAREETAANAKPRQPQGRAFKPAPPAAQPSGCAPAQAAARPAAPAVEAHADAVQAEEGSRNPDGALKFRHLQMQDEKGRIPLDGLIKAKQHVGRMRAARQERMLALEKAGKPTLGLEGAGIDPNSWAPLGPGNIGGRIRSILIHPTEPNKMWLGSVSGGIWRTTDTGASWQPVNDFMTNLAVSTMVMDPSNPNIMYAGTGEGFTNIDAVRGAGIFKSIDGGVTWNQLPATVGINFSFVNRLTISQDGSTLLAATQRVVDVNNVIVETGGVWRSTDGGMTWNRRTNIPAFDIDFLGTDATRAVVGELGTARYSLDGGVTWTAATFTPSISSGTTGATNGRVELATHKSFPLSGFVYVSVNQNGGEIYRSNDSGQTFTRYSTGANYLSSDTADSSKSIGWYTNAIWSNPQDPDDLIVGGVHLWRGRIDFATGTTPLTQISDGANGSAHPDHHVIVEHPGFNNTTNRLAYFGNDGGIYGADLAVGWLELNNTLSITQFYGAAVNNTSGVVVGGTQDNGTLRFSGNTENWNQMRGSDGGYSAADQTDANYFYGTEQNLVVVRSTDGGVTSSSIAAGLTDSCPNPTPPGCTPQTNFIAPIVLDPNDTNTLLAGGWSLWRSPDVKAPTPSWVVIKSPVVQAPPPPPATPFPTPPISAITVAPNTSDLILVGHNNGDIYRTLNGTALPPTWCKIDDPTQMGCNIIGNNLPNRLVTRLVVDPNHPTPWYYATFGGFSNNNVWRTTNGGSTWTDVSGAPGLTDLPAVPVRTLVVNPDNPNFLYVGTEIGIFTSEDGGANWGVSQDGPANVSVDELFFRSDKTLYAATHGRGVYRTSTPIRVPPMVTNTIDDPNNHIPGSLRAAIADTALVTATARRIYFNIPGNGVHTINLSTGLSLNDMEIDGWSQAGTGYSGQPLIEINGAGATTMDANGNPVPTNGLSISNGSKVSGLTINRFSGAGIRVFLTGNNSVRGCFIGTNREGTAAAGNATGVLVESSNNTIGRQVNDNVGDNLISGNGVGIQISGPGAAGNQIRGNLIGTDVTGNNRLSNTLDGIRINNAPAAGSPANIIGGTDTQAGNIISGNGVNNFGADGIEITGPTAAGNIIRGNYIGLGANGNTALGNLGSGVRIDNVPGTIIGGTDAAARNIIADNRNASGIALLGAASSGTTIQGNYIGTNFTGNAAVPNIYGIYAESGNNLIGGTAAGAGNVISSGIGIYLLGVPGATGNTIQGNYIGTNADGSAPLNPGGTGIELRGGASGTQIGGTTTAARNIISGNAGAVNILTPNNAIQGNYIGTNPTATTALPNVRGISIDGGTVAGAANNLVGGASGGAGNVISGNGTGGNHHAISIANASGVLVQGNRLGTNSTGLLAIPNGGSGIQVFNSLNTVIGGATLAAGNIISANRQGGIILSSGSNGTVIQGNSIGTTPDFAVSLGNGFSTGAPGIEIGDGSHIIGGTNPGEGNNIAFNGCAGCGNVNNGSGIRVFSAGNRIRGNSMRGNVALGLDLSGGSEGTNRVTANDACDTDTGPNNLQNFPVLTLANSINGNTLVTGTLNSNANTSFAIDFYSNSVCDPSGNGEGQTYLGSTIVNTDASCNANINATLPVALVSSQTVTATATRLAANLMAVETSEFSACRSVTEGPLPTVRVVNTSGDTGVTVAVPMELVALGDENSAAFSLNFDTARLNNASAALGSGAAGATLTVDTTQAASGRLGLTIAAPAGQNFGTGTRQLAVVTFNVVGNAAFTTPLTLGDAPTARSLQNTANAPLAAAFAGGNVTIRAAFEGDMAPRPNGNGTVSSSDVTQARRFLGGLDAINNGSEFQRADSAPRSSGGNGSFSATDITQVRRYAGGLDAATSANGPSSPSGSAPQPLPNAPSARTVRLPSQTAVPGTQITVPVELESMGDEVALSFSVTFNPALLSVNNDPSRITLGSGVPPGTTLTRNVTRAAQGQIGILLDTDLATPFAAGARQLVTITFDVSGSLQVTPLDFGDVPVVRDASDANANTLPVNFAPGMVSITSPTLARVESYAAYHFAEGNVILWQSSFEAANLGFEVYRQQGGERVLLTRALIAGSALFAGPETMLTAGNSYSWLDSKGSADSIYWVQDIDLNGSKTWYGPIATADCGLLIADCPAQVNSPVLNELGNGADENRWLTSYPACAPETPTTLLAGSDPWLQQQRIAAGPAVKISVRATGWQRVTGAQLLAAGLPPLAEHRFLQLYAAGRELPLLVDAANLTITNDSFVEFYGMGLDTRETDSNIYWLVAGDRPGLRVGPPVRVGPRGGEIGVKGGGETVPPDSANSFDYTVERKERAIYFAALDNGEERENFFGAIINQDGTTRSLPLTRLDHGSNTPAQAQIKLQGVTEAAHSVRIVLNGQELGLINFNGKENKTAQFSVAPTALREGENTLTLEARNGAADISLVDSLKLTYPRLYEADNNRLWLTTGARQRLTVGGFTRPHLRLFDVTDPQHAFQIAARTEPTASGYALHVNGNMTGRALLAVADDAVLPPAAVTANEPTNWTNIERGVDFLILAHRSLRSEAQPLATVRNAQGLNTELITIEDIYDEFSGGVKDSTAITAFLRWTQTRWTRAPRYLLLVGDASYDPRNYLGLGDFDLTPTRYVGTPYLETSSDELITDFDGDGLGEMAVGRLPTRTLAETQAAFVKLLYYYQPANQSGALLVADRSDGFNFSGLNEELGALLPDNMPVTIVNRAASTDAQARQIILNALAQGPSIVNYAGHGSVQTWTGAGLLRSSDAANLGNGNRLPFFVMMTCLNGYFHDLNSESLAEALVKAQHGGAIAAWGSTTLTLPTEQALMNRELLRQLYRPGAPPRLGDAVRQAKLAVSDPSIRRSWTLFGDPTLTLR